MCSDFMSENKKIKVLHILSALTSGGAETNLLALLHCFDKGEFEHAVAYGGGGELEQEFSVLGIKLIKLSDYPLGFRDILKLRKILRKISDFQPDIIHSHLDMANIFGLVAGYVTGAKVLLHFHGFGIFYKELSAVSRLNSFIWRVLSRSYRYCDCAIAICDYQVSYLKRAGIDKKKIIKIQNGININQGDIQPAVLNGINTENVYCFVSVARFHRQKNHELLIASFSDVVQRFPDVYLVLVGDGPCRSQIEKQIKMLGLENKISLLGVRRDIPNINESCDCFVQASSWELSPITLLEAMRARRPVIATDVGGVSEVVDDHESGLLVESNNRTKLVEAMIYMVIHPRHSSEMGEAGYGKVVKELSNSIVAKKIEDVYMGFA